MLIGDLTDQFLEQVLDRNQARDVAELVYHHCQMCLGGLHLAQQVGGSLGLRNEKRRPGEVANLLHPLPGGVGSKDVFGQDHSDDIAVSAVAQRIAGETMFGRQGRQRGDVGVPIDGDHVCPGNHHLANNGVGELEDGVDQLALLLLFIAATRRGFVRL